MSLVNKIQFKLLNQISGDWQQDDPKPVFNERTISLKRQKVYVDLICPVDEKLDTIPVLSHPH